MPKVFELRRYREFQIRLDVAKFGFDDFRQCFRHIGIKGRYQPRQQHCSQFAKFIRI